MSVPSIPKDQFLAIKQLWQTKLALEEKVKSLEAICNINGKLKSILENLTKEFRAIPGSSISDTTGGSTVVDPATINHELLGGLLGGAANDHQHLTTAELAALHPAVTVADTASIDLTINGQTLTAGVLPAGVDHNSLANLTTGDPHTQYTENSGSITQLATRNHNDLQNINGGADLQHMTAAQISALHARSHAITSTSDHTGTAGDSGYLMKADANGLPVKATNTDAAVAAAVTASHARQHSLQSADDHTSTATAGTVLKADANKLPADSGITETAGGDVHVGSAATPIGKLDVSKGAAAAVVVAATYANNATDKAVFLGFHSKSDTIGEIVATDDNTPCWTGQGQIVKAGTPDVRFIIGEIIMRQNGASNAPGGDIEFWLSNAGDARKLNHVMLSDGRVGIGTGAPSSKTDILDVDKTGNYGNLFVRTSDAQAANKGGKIMLGGLFTSSDNDIAPFAAIRGVKENSTNGNYAGAAIIETLPNGGSLAERVRITSAGNVGIGTATPAEKLSVAGNIESTGTYGNKIIIKNSATPVVGASTSIEMEDTGSTPNKHRIWLSSLINTTYLEHKNNGGADIGRFSVISDNGAGNLWIANNDATPALNDNMGGLTFGTAGGTSSHIFIALHGDYATGKTGGGQLLLYQRDSTDTIRQNVTFDGLNRRVGINDAAPGEALDVSGNINVTGVLKIDDVQVVKERQAAIADASAGTEIATINSILAALRAHGLIAT